MALLPSLLLLGHLSMVWTINMTFFPCDLKGNEVDCSDRLLDQMPSFHSKKITLLDLSYNQIRTLHQDSFQDVPNLRVLEINCIPTCQQQKPYHLEIHCHAFTTLQKLEKLSLCGNSLSSLPCLPESLKILDVQNNNLFRIDCLKAPNLEILFLSKNCFYANNCNQSFHISEKVLKHLTKLKNLTLAYNNLKTVPKGLPSSLLNLQLQENTIEKIPNNSFENLTKLVYLNLEWNCQRCDHAVRHCYPCPNNASLQLYSHSLFSKNSSLSYLSLRGNSLKGFPDGIFTPLKKLSILDLSDNLLAPAIQNGTFFRELRNVKWMSIMFNYEPKITYSELNFSPHLANVSRLRTLLVSGFFFRKLSNESYNVLSRLHNLAFLGLSMNFINSCDMTALSRLSSIRTIDISQNMLTGTTGLCQKPQEYSLLKPFVQIERQVHTVQYGAQQDLSISKFFSIKGFRSEICDNGLTFNLSANDILFLDKDLFEGMEKAVCIDLSLNFMNQAVKNGLFPNLTKLTYLDLSYNRFDLYYSGSFSELKNTLKVLDLSNNNFHFNLKGMGHSFEFLDNLTELTALSLANNNIGMRISKELKSSSLNYLYFSGNHLGFMWVSNNDNYNYFFQNLKNLTFLDISSNSIINISPIIWCNFPKSLTYLRISWNELTSFPWEYLPTLLHLEYLDLSHNRIQHLPLKIEFGNNFSTLDLSYNKIGFIPDLFLSNISLQCPRGFSLYLDHNQIKEFSQDPFQSQIKNLTLRKLTLHHNPFRCDCGTAWFADFLSTTTIDIPYLTTSVQCGYPESQQHKPMLYLAGQSSCQDIYGRLAFLVCSFLWILLTALPLLNHLYSWDLWYSFQVLWAGYKGYSRIAGSDSKHNYDAFVLFDTKNPAVRDWVYNELIFHLEKTEHRRFGLCLEERDWIPGLSCIENLHNAVYKSVKTVFVLSCGGDTANGVIRQAFFMVQQRLLDEKVDSAVLVLLDDMFPKVKYLQLRQRLCKRSVLTWPKNPKAQPLFWNHMRAALSSDNLKLYDKKMAESFA